ncbi:GNAT family N-acetyltransferase [Jeotgalibacillus campisalis]|uniref:N-acetyltransferase n=1 Tax=Jeotgalibacillus campisalis TaxID=220754 RepID=A0A0C2W592_9BACL|nr:GNAT family N-acetyltransferase [Jeotgalibacillus campisalis]KIL51193.1 N-acetyltransferase [Jeotgalibacillus campisalis]
MEIRLDDLSGKKIQKLIREHLNNMLEHSPPESKHALDIEALKNPDITFWSVWEEDELLGCGALKELDAQHGEIKSMRTSTAHLRKGAARKLLTFIIEESRHRGYKRISLETGSMQAFEPARRLYLSFGFTFCAPFNGYKEDRNSLFMTKEV